VSRDLATDLSKHLAGDLPPRTAISPRIGAGDGTSERQPQGCDADHRRQATALFLLEEDLRQQRPQRDDWRRDGIVILAENDSLVLQDRGDPLIR
jgi:hypothetical protein